MKPGRLLRAIMTPDTPSAVEERMRYAKIREQVNREREELFPSITAENAGAMIEWQTRRLRELQDI